MKKDSKALKGKPNHKPDALVPTREYSAEEWAMISRSKDRRRDTPPKYQQMGEKQVRNISVVLVRENADLDLAKVFQTWGTADESLSTFFANQVVHNSPERLDAVERINNTVTLMYGIAPNNEVEAMLGLQMVATHNLAMELLGRAMRADCRDATCDNINMATKLLRTYTSQMEALNRNWGKSPSQKVTVEHVHVNAGGQAIVGSVEAKPAVGGRGREGGDDKK